MQTFRSLRPVGSSEEANRSGVMERKILDVLALFVSLETRLSPFFSRGRNSSNRTLLKVKDLLTKTKLRWNFLKSSK